MPHAPLLAIGFGASLIMVAGRAASAQAAGAEAVGGVALQFNPAVDAPSRSLLAAPQAANEAASDVRLAVYQDGDDDDVSTVQSHFGAEGSRRFNIMGGGGVDLKDSEDRLAQLGVGISWFFVENLSLDLELNAMYFDERDEDIYGANFNLLFRWHFLARETWSIYVDGGAGLLGTTNDVPFNGSSFNFTPQAGVGFSIDVFENTRLMAGVRWHHVSNANTYEENPGMDSVMLYAGLSFGF